MRKHLRVRHILSQVLQLLLEEVAGEFYFVTATAQYWVQETVLEQIPVLIPILKGKSKNVNFILLIVSIKAYGASGAWRWKCRDISCTLMYHPRSLRRRASAQ